MTIEGLAVWQAATACIAVGFGSVSVDMTAALAITGAHGVPPPTAAQLLLSFQVGLQASRAESRDADQDDAAGRTPHGPS